MCSVPFSQLVMSLNANMIELGFSPKPFRAQSRLIPVARIEGHEQSVDTIGMINRDKTGIAFQKSMAVRDGFKSCFIGLIVFHEGPCPSEPVLEIFKIWIQQLRSMNAGSKRDQRDDDNSHRTGIIARARSGSPVLNRITFYAL
jgi:hypothetical protein